MPIKGTVTTLALANAVRAAGVFASPINTIRLSFNSSSLVVSGQCADYGDTAIEIKDAHNVIWEENCTYTHAGQDIDIYFNYKQLLDALSGMPDITEYALDDPRCTAYFAGTMPDKTRREVALMPMAVY